MHVPFCFHKCHYCDFYSISRQTPERMHAFVDRLLREADSWTDRSAAPIRPRTVFFGGGTPSLLPLDAMARLLRGLRDRFDLSNVDEWTVEVNPATATCEYMAMLLASGVTRISIGAQSFDDRDLKALERHHDPEDVPRTVEFARMVGFSRINIDLIFAVPGQTPERWAKILEQALVLATPHLSCYALTYEPNTPLAVRRRLGHVQPVNEAAEMEMLLTTRRRLAAAMLDAYEISNFAVQGEACRHNLLYWDAGDYIGLGPSAASHVSGIRWKNRAHLGEWERALDTTAELPASEFEVLSLGQRVGEHAMLRLRLAAGIDFASFENRWGIDARQVFADPMDRYLRAGLLTVDARRVALTETGIPVADAIASEFLAAAAKIEPPESADQAPGPHLG